MLQHPKKNMDVQCTHLEICMVNPFLIRIISGFICLLDKSRSNILLTLFWSPPVAYKSISVVKAWWTRMQKTGGESRAAGKYFYSWDV